MKLEDLDKINELFRSEERFPVKIDELEIKKKRKERSLW